MSDREGEAESDDHDHDLLGVEREIAHDDDDIDDTEDQV